MKNATTSANIFESIIANLIVLYSDSQINSDMVSSYIKIEGTTVTRFECMPNWRNFKAISREVIRNATPNQLSELIDKYMVRYIVCEGCTPTINADERLMKAKFYGKCSVTGKSIQGGQTIAYNPSNKKARLI